MIIYVNDFWAVQQETVELESIGEPEKSSGQGGIEKAKLDGHTIQVHMKIKNFECDKCNYRFSQKGNSNAHKN